MRDGVCPWANGERAKLMELRNFVIDAVRGITQVARQGGKPDDLPSPKAYPWFIYAAFFLRCSMARR